MHIFEGLVDLDPATLVARPALATEMPKKINATTYRATLRKGATFHDGSAVTADDVVFSFERILDPKNASLMAQFVPFIDTVKAVDAGTVEFKLKYPFALFPSRIAVARIVPKKIVEPDPKAFDAKPVGSGPYRFVEATREDKIVFEAYDKYNGPHQAKAKKMIWRLMSDQSARVSAMESGRVQAIEDVPYIDVKRLAGSSKTESVQSFGLLFLMFNTADKRFADKRVRQALHHALDTEKIISTAMAGNAAPATGYVPATHPDQDRWPDQLFRVLSMAGVAIPSFWLGVPLIQQFALNTRIFPTGGYTSPADSVSGWLTTMALPAISLALPVSASLARLVRTSMVAELDRDYVRTARGNGLPPLLVIRSVLRNALVTPLTVLGIKVGYMLSGAVVIEAIFDLPGMGKLILEGVTGGDVALVQGTVLTIAIAFLMVNVIVDLLYLLVNPRIRTV
ncbi:ABC transporter substrate-binding protein [Streptomyces sp. NPDC058316]|uniref:ABC transporter substrate-binding protein n=1 Tax=unclassified Streptomyces TaxID=2593676 RepID=UPI0033167231